MPCCLSIILYEAYEFFAFDQLSSVSSFSLLRAVSSAGCVRWWLCMRHCCSCEGGKGRHFGYETTSYISSNGIFESLFGSLQHCFPQTLQGSLFQRSSCTHFKHRHRIPAYLKDDMQLILMICKKFVLYSMIALCARYREILTVYTYATVIHGCLPSHLISLHQPLVLAGMGDCAAAFITYGGPSLTRRGRLQ